MFVSRSWPAVIGSLMAVGAVLLGFGILTACYMDDIAATIVLIALDAAFIAGGVWLLCWYLKKKKQNK